MSILKPLDSGAAYIYCVTCRDNGNPKSMLTRNNHMVQCQFGHSWDLSSYRQLLARQPEMVKMEDMLIEQPDPRCIKWPVYVMPDTKEEFEKKYHGRVHVTIGTFIAALCEDSLLILSGEDVLKLKKRGITTSAQVIAAIEGVEQLERERQQAVDQVLKMTNMLRQLQGE